MEDTLATGPTVAAAAGPLEALPVVMELARPDAARVVAWIEGVLGWQPVDGAGGGLPARLRLVDVAAAAPPAPGWAGEYGIPTVLLVSADDLPLAVAESVRHVRPSAVVAWPDGRDELVATATRLLARARPAAADELLLRVAGAAGGVGTTTVALALGALAAWRHGATLVLTWGAVPLVTPRTLALDALAGQRTFDQAPPVAGVPGLRVVRTVAPAGTAPVDAGPAAVVVRDLGVTDDADVLVLRRDAAGIAALERSAAAVAVVLDDGLAPTGAIAAAGGGRPSILLPRSVRVARAGLLQRVPTALPASYLRALRPLVIPERGHGG